MPHRQFQTLSAIIVATILSFAGTSSALCAELLIVIDEGNGRAARVLSFGERTPGPRTSKPELFDITGEVTDRYLRNTPISKACAAKDPSPGFHCEGNGLIVRDNLPPSAYLPKDKFEYLRITISPACAAKDPSPGFHCEGEGRIVPDIPSSSERIGISPACAAKDPSPGFHCEGSGLIVRDPPSAYLPKDKFEHLRIGVSRECALADPSPGFHCEGKGHIVADNFSYLLDPKGIQFDPSAPRLPDIHGAKDVPKLAFAKASLEWVRKQSVDDSSEVNWQLLEVIAVLNSIQDTEDDKEGKKQADKDKRVIFDIVKAITMDGPKGALKKALKEGFREVTTSERIGESRNELIHEAAYQLQRRENYFFSQSLLLLRLEQQINQSPDGSTLTNKSTDSSLPNSTLLEILQEAETRHTREVIIRTIEIPDKRRAEPPHDEPKTDEKRPDRDTTPAKVTSTPKADRTELPSHTSPSTPESNTPSSPTKAEPSSTRVPEPSSRTSPEHETPVPGRR